MARYGLPEGYAARAEPVYFDDVALADSAVVHQPEVYAAADYFLRESGRTTIIDIGCGNGRKLRGVRADRHVGLDFGANLAWCRARHPDAASWHEVDLSDPACVGMAALADERAVVVCADVVEHLVDPLPLTGLLAACCARGALVLTSTPDRIRVRGAAHAGPPPNPAHVREWALDEYAGFLAGQGLPAIFAGYTLNNSESRELKTIVTIHDRRLGAALRDRAVAPRPLAIMATYNEADVIGETASDLLHQGCDVAVIDTWSNDGTWELLGALANRHGARLRIERFPAAAPLRQCSWRDVLNRKADLAAAHPGRWVLHTDADELRRSPFPGLTLAEGLAVAGRTGATRVDFTVLNFRPVAGPSYAGGALARHFTHFEFGTRPGHFQQKKAWLQGAERVDLATSGGHTAVFAGARDFAYKFRLQHYPIRSPAHGRRKVLLERRGRWSPEERQLLGWHTQYDAFTAESSFLWPESGLHEYGPSFWPEHGLLVLTDLARRRLEASGASGPGEKPG